MVAALAPLGSRFHRWREVHFSVRSALIQRFATAGFEVRTAATGRQAIEYFRGHSEEIACVILDLTMPQLKVLLSLFVAGPLPCSSLADFMGASLPTMNGVLERLKERGLIVRRPDHQDRRRLLNSLTARGHQLIDGLWTSGQDWLSDLLDRMHSTDLETIEQAMTIIVEALSRQEQHAWTG